MAQVHADRVKETSTTTGTGTYSLAGPVPGFQGFVVGIGTGNTCFYVATDGTDWEVGEGTVTDGAPDTLARTEIHASSNAGSGVSWAAGTKTIFCTLTAQAARELAPKANPDLTGEVRITQTGAALASSYALSVQDNASTVWLELLNNVGAGAGAFFGLSGSSFEIYAINGGELAFYTDPAAGGPGVKRFVISPGGAISALFPFIGTTGTWSGLQTIAGTAEFFTALVAQLTHDGPNGGPYMFFTRVSASPAANDNLGAFVFRGKDSAAANVDYASFGAVISDPTDGSEDGFLDFYTIVAGVNTLAFRMGLGGIRLGGTPTGDLMGAGALNAKDLYDDGIIVPPLLFKALIADETGGNVSTAQPWFPTAGAVTVEASTSYFFEGVLLATRAAGTTSHTTGVLFGGTATLTSIAYEALAKSSVGAALTAMSGHHGIAATELVVTAASTSATENLLIEVKGVVRINAGGTLIPQFKFSAAPGGVPTILKNSFFRLRKIGSNVVATSGTWA